MSLPSPIQLTLVAMIWLGWMSTLGKKTLQRYRDSLLKTYTENKEIAQQLDELCEAENFEDFLKIVKEKQHWLMQLCQT